MRSTWKAVGLALTVCLLLAAGPAHAAFEIDGFGGKLSRADGTPSTQAGAHADVLTKIDFSTVETDGGTVAAGNVRDVRVDLPRGLVGDSTTFPTCTMQQLLGSRSMDQCPRDTQVGTVLLKTAILGFPIDLPAGIFNVEPPPGVAARFGFAVVGTGIMLDARVRASDDGYRIAIESIDSSQGLPILGVETTFWGVPGDPVHDPFKYGPGNSGPRVPFLTAPTTCSGVPLEMSLSVNTWQEPGVFHTASFDHDVDGNPILVDGCDALPFDPRLEVDPGTSRADAPSALRVDVAIPQNADPDGLGSAHLKDATVVLPEGMTISPASADGLASCSDAGIGMGLDGSVSCPPASKIGSVVIETPVLEQPLPGAIYVGEQRSGDPESGEMFRIFLVIDDPDRGVVIKLAGKVRANRETGRLTTSFEGNPQLPVARVSLRFKDGPRAPLATPLDCGTKTVRGEFTSWAKPEETLVRTDTFTIDCPSGAGFSPSFAAGSIDPTGGVFAPFAVRIDRTDGQQFMSGVTIEMPEGTLAKLRGVPLCGAAQAANGGCSNGSRVGTATVGAGSGSSPYFLQGSVYLTEGYRGAPYGLAAHVHAKAGPYDLGWVRVRQALHVDPETARVTVVSDPLPQIVNGVPVRLRSVNVDVDRSQFVVNPTSCAEKRIGATLTSIDGVVHETSSRFQVGDCAALGFKPRLGLRLVGKRQMRSGGHPALRATVRQARGQANIRRARVTLPRNVVLDATNSADPKLLCGYDASLKADCPASTIIGKASLSTPILNRKLSGPVHLVQGIRFENGNRIRGLPTLLVKLRGEVSINLRSKTAVDSRDRLVSIFPRVPDAPMSKFSLQVNGGKKGILVVTETRQGRIDLCARKQTALIDMTGHNGKRADYPARVKTPCAQQKRPRR